MKPISRLLLIIGLLLLISGCTPAPALPSPSTPPTTSAEFYPTQGWRSATPESQGMDPGLIAQALAAVQSERIGLHSLLVIRHGYIVSETYFQGQTAATRHELYSVTKSFTGTLVGIAVQQNLLELNRPVLTYFPTRSFSNIDARKQALTVENLLTMTAGLDWTESDASYTAMYRSSDWISYMLNLPMAAEPGKVFLYNSGASHVLSGLLNEVLRPQGLEPYSFAQKVLFRPLGIDPLWERDSQNIPIGGWGLQITPRDMAKLGYLYLHEGLWEGQQVVPAEWVRAATQKQAPTVPGDLGYGYQWWVYPLKGEYARYPAYAAQGRFGQTIFVVSALDLVLVTTAQIDNHDPIYKLIDQYIVPAAK